MFVSCAHICVLVHMCSRIRVLLCVCTHVYSLRTHSSAYTRLRSCSCMCVLMCVYTYVCARVCFCVCVCTRMGVVIRFLAFSDSKERTPTSHATARPGCAGQREPLGHGAQNRRFSTKIYRVNHPARGPRTAGWALAWPHRHEGPRAPQVPGSRTVRAAGSGAPSTISTDEQAWGALPSQDPLSSQATSQVEAPRGSQGALPMPPAMSGVKARVPGRRAAP